MQPILCSNISMNIPIPPEIEHFRVARAHDLNPVLPRFSPAALLRQHPFSPPRCLPPAFRFLKTPFTVAPIVLLFFLCLMPARSHAQEVDTTRTPSPNAPDSLLHQPAPQNLPGPSNSGGASALKNPVNFTASDSLIIKIGEAAGDVGSMFGNVQVNYGETKLAAHEEIVIPL